MIDFTPWRVSREPIRQILDLLRSDYRFIHEVDDTLFLEGILAAYFANLLPGPPVWLLLVGPASSGKTVTLNLLLGLPNIQEASAVTEAALLSGTPGKEKAKNASGGLLRIIGAFGIVLMKDFTSLLSMGKEKLMAVMAAFREVYDGSWKRDFGVDGGKSECWKGKLGILGCVTEIIDEKHEARQLMGERFMMLRASSSEENSLRIADRALQERPEDASRSQEIQLLAQTLMDYFKAPAELPELTQELRDRIKSLAYVVSRARSAVDRNGYTREVESLPQPEEPARLSKQLKMSFFGFLAIGCTEAEAWNGVKRIGFDSMPAIRRRMLFRLHTVSGALHTADLAEETKGIHKLAIRALEELSFFGMVNRIDLNENHAIWELSKIARVRMDLILTPLESEKDEAKEDGFPDDRTEPGLFPLSSTPPRHVGESRSDSREPIPETDQADGSQQGTRKAG